MTRSRVRTTSRTGTSASHGGQLEFSYRPDDVRKGGRSVLAPASAMTTFITPHSSQPTTGCRLFSLQSRSMTTVTKSLLARHVVTRLSEGSSSQAPIAFSFQYQNQVVQTSELSLSPDLIIKGTIETQFDCLGIALTFLQVFGSETTIRSS